MGVRQTGVWTKQREQVGHLPFSFSPGPIPYPSQVQVSLFAMSPEVYSWASVWPGHRFPIDKEKSQAGQH